MSRFTKWPFNLIEDFVQQVQESNYTNIIRSFVRTETNLIPLKETDEGECLLIRITCVSPQSVSDSPSEALYTSTPIHWYRGTRAVSL